MAPPPCGALVLLGRIGIGQTERPRTLSGAAAWCLPVVSHLDRWTPGTGATLGGVARVGGRLVRRDGSGVSRHHARHAIAETEAIDRRGDGRAKARGGPSDVRHRAPPRAWTTLDDVRWPTIAPTPGAGNGLFAARHRIATNPGAVWAQVVTR